MSTTAAPGTTSSPRANQKARTRAAIVAAAVKLVREGRPPSIAEAAEAALVSTATAYRYFTSAEDLWQEASVEAAGIDDMLEEIHDHVVAAGDDAVRRGEVAAREVGRQMLADQLPYRLLAKGAHERWIAQRDLPPDERTPVRQGRRTKTAALVVDPLRGALPDGAVDRIAAALGLVSGTDVIFALVDALGLEGDDALELLVDANRWLLRGALAELEERASPARGAGRARSSRR